MLQPYNKLLIERNNIVQLKYPSLGSTQSSQQIRQKAWWLDEWLAPHTVMSGATVLQAELLYNWNRCRTLLSAIWSDNLAKTVIYNS